MRSGWKRREPPARSHQATGSRTGPKKVTASGWAVRVKCVPFSVSHPISGTRRRCADGNGRRAG